jgi:hypothetical protein
MAARGEAISANQSVNGLLNRLVQPPEAREWDFHSFPQPHPVVRAGTFAAALVLVCAALFVPQARGFAGSALDIAIAALSVTMASPIAWDHHYGVLLPALVLAAGAHCGCPRPGGGGSWPRRRFVLAARSGSRSCSSRILRPTWCNPTCDCRSGCAVRDVPPRSGDCADGASCGRMSVMASEVLRLVHGINLEPVHEEFTLDCRLLFMGDRYRQLLRAYPEVIHRLSRPKPLAEVAAFLRESAEIAQYYAISADAQKVAVTLRDEIFREPQPLASLDCR